MKKRIYYIIYSVVQILVSVYMFFCAEVVAEQQIQALQQTFSVFPAQMRDIMDELYTLEQMIPSIIFTAIVGVILGSIFLWIAIRDKVSSHKGLAIGLSIASLLLFGSGIVMIMSVITLILVANTKSDSKSIKEKKKIEKLKSLKVTSKDRLWVVVLLLAYSTQFIVPYFITSNIVNVVFAVAFYVLIFIFVLYIFSKRLNRDFGALKNNFGAYVGCIFKYWGIMLGLSMLAAFIRMILGGNVVTANQDGLNSMPLWYIGPLSIIWAPVVEEGIFRGGVRRFISNDKIFIIVSAILFGLLHTVGTEIGIYNIFIQSLQYMVMGGAMAYAYSKTNNICVNIGMHAVQNTVSVILMILMGM